MNKDRTLDTITNRKFFVTDWIGKFIILCFGFLFFFFCFAFSLIYSKLHCIHTRITNQVFKCHSTSLFSMKMFFITSNRSMCTYIMNLSRFILGLIFYNALNRNSNRKYSFPRSVVLYSRWGTGIHYIWMKIRTQNVEIFDKREFLQELNDEKYHNHKNLYSIPPYFSLIFNIEMKCWFWIPHEVNTCIKRFKLKLSIFSV